MKGILQSAPIGIINLANNSVLFDHDFNHGKHLSLAQCLDQDNRYVCVTTSCPLRENRKYANRENMTCWPVVTGLCRSLS